MRVLYTYWSKSINPDLVEVKKNIDLFLLYQTVSLYYLRNNIPDGYTIDIITDSFGKKLFEENIPKFWDNIYVEMDEFNHYSIDRWALVKILKIFSLTPPFLHLDYDVLIKSGEIFKSLLQRGDINFMYQSGEPIVNHAQYREALKKMKHLLRRYRLYPTIAYNAGFTYIKKDLPAIGKEIVKYSSIEGKGFCEDMFFEQIIVPAMISKEERLFTLNDLKRITTKRIRFYQNEIDELDYYHYASNANKERHLEYIKTEYQKIINNNA